MLIDALGGDVERKRKDERGPDSDMSRGGTELDCDLQESRSFGIIEDLGTSL